MRSGATFRRLIYCFGSYGSDKHTTHVTLKIVEWFFERTNCHSR